MIEVDVSNLNSEIYTLNELLEELEELKLNLFNELKDSCINWYDGHSLQFDEKMHLDSRETDRIIKSLKRRKEVYDYISYKYGEIGEYIKCNLSKEEALISKIDSCIDTCSTISGELSDGLVSLSDAQSDVNDAIDTLKSFKQAIKAVLAKIRDFEHRINTRISALELVNINELDFDIDTEVGE